MHEVCYDEMVEMHYLLYYCVVVRFLMVSLDFYSAL